MSKNYEVTISIEFQGYNIETTKNVEAYSEEEAKENAKSKTEDNLLFHTTNCEFDEENNEGNVTVCIEHDGYSLEADLVVNGYDEADCKDNAIERARDNHLVFATNVEETEED